MNSLTYNHQKSKHWLAFFTALGTAAVIFLPFIIYNKGLFIYIGDFNVQQIPFYKLAHEAVRSGDIFWSWYTDLGANFIGSYSFYLAFSPFFWLTLPFPTEALPYLMAPLLVLKTACAALTSYFFLQRFVRDKNYAVIGSLLYAFSGFTAYNIFFNHFHEAIVFFPLMLIGLEELLVNNRRGAFAITVAINAVVNYWFFVGEVVFVILYYFIRCSGLKGAIKKFFWVAFEAVLGVLCALFALLPSVLAVMGNPRTTMPDNMLGGWQFWLYTHEQRQPGILASFFFPPETPSRPNMFPDHGAKWASLSAWLPVFSMSGVLAFLISVRKNWLRKMLIACFVIAMVPGFNSLFVGLNHSYYTRWFYMLVLLLCTATIISLENEKIDLMRGFRWTAVVTGVILLALGFTPVLKDGAIEKIGLANDMQIFWIYAAMAVLSLLLCYLLVAHARFNDNFTRTVIVVLALFSVSYTALYIGMSKQDLAGDNYIINNGVMGRRNLKMPDVDKQFYRMDIYDSGDNFGMYWHIPNIQTFHSVVPSSIMKFYPEIGVKRDVSSRPQPEFYALRSLFSVKYLFIGTDKEDQEPMPGYFLTSKQLEFNIYENENYVPMGFTFDGFITEDELKEVPEADRHKILMRALVLNEEQAVRFGTMLNHVVVSEDMFVDYTDFLDDVAARRANSCYYFKKDTRGFTARSNLNKPGLMFFSVPFDKGWSATVNGEPAEIETVDIGFMAVKVPAGEAEIRFNYMTPGLLPGIAVTGGAVIILVVYWMVARRVYPRKKRKQTYELFDDEIILEDQLEDQLSLEECLDTYEAQEEYKESPSEEVANAVNINWSEEDFIGKQEQTSPQKNSKPKQFKKKRKHKK